LLAREAAAGGVDDHGTAQPGSSPAAVTIANVQ
jgi:hypothetical protein